MSMPVSTYRTNRVTPGMTHARHPGAPTGKPASTRPVLA